MKVIKNYYYKSAVEVSGVESLFDKSRRYPNDKNRVDEAARSRVLSLAVDFPAYGQFRGCEYFYKGKYINGCKQIYLCKK